MGYGRKDTKLIQMTSDHKNDVGLMDSRIGFRVDNIDDLMGKVMEDIFKKSKLSTGLKLIEHNREILRRGGVNVIPFNMGPEMDQHLEGLTHGDYVMLAADSGVGKTKFAKFLTITNPMHQRYLLKKEGKSMDFKTVYYGFEESEEDFILSMISNRLYRKYKKFVSIKELESRKGILSNEVVDIIREDEEFYDELFSRVFFMEFVTNPYLLIKMIRNLAIRVGNFYRDGRKLIPPKGSWKEFVFDKYERKDPDTFVHMVFDHIALINNLSNMNERETLEKFTFDPLRIYVSKMFKMIPVIVQMLTGTAGSRDNVKANMILPSKNLLGNAKSTYNNVMIALGLTDPSKYEMKSYAGYPTFDLNGNLRIFNIFKNRKGTAQAMTPMCFYGSVDMMYKLPSMKKIESIARNQRKSPEQIMEQIKRMVLKNQYRQNL